MSETANPKLVLVRKLLASAESEALLGHVEAADGFRNKAMSLMVAHGLSDAMVAAGQHRDDKPIQVAIETPNPYSRDKQYLIFRVARGLGVQCVRITGTKTSMLVGFSEDIERVEMLYTSLLVQAFGEMNKIDAEAVIPVHRWLTPAQKRSERAAYNRSWLQGYSIIVGERLEDAQRRAAQEYETQTGKSTELVVVDRKDRVELAYKNAFPKVHTQRRNLSGQGRNAGKEAGRRADIGNKRVGGTRAALNS